MKNSITNFEIIYKNEVQSILQRIHFQEAIILWQSNNSKSAIREKLNPFIFSNSRITILYVLVHILPVKYYNKLISFKNGVL